MTFGFLGAPYHFQYIMDRTLSLDPKLLALVVFDDVMTHGAHWSYVWDQTLRALRVITSIGFMVNLRKCHFLVARAVVLGMDISRALCSLGDKYVKCW